MQGDRQNRDCSTLSLGENALMLGAVGQKNNTIPGLGSIPGGVSAMSVMPSPCAQATHSDRVRLEPWPRSAFCVAIGCNGEGEDGVDCYLSKLIRIPDGQGTWGGLADFHEKAMVGHGRPWSAMVGHGRPWSAPPPTVSRKPMVGHGRPWSAMVGHGRRWCLAGGDETGCMKL